MTEMSLDEYLFDPEVIRNVLTSSDGESSFLKVPEGLVMRPLKRSDYSRGFVELLSQLTSVGNFTQSLFEARFDAMKRCPDTYYTIVLEDPSISKIVGAVTLVVEQKFIHAAALRARVEDAVVDQHRRGQDLGKLLLRTATALSKELNCYKVSLECKDPLVKFYSQFDYKVDPGNNYMIQRFHD